MIAKKAEKLRLIEEGAAKKLQCLVRKRVARKQVEAKRAEKKAMLEAESKRYVEEVGKIAADEQKLDVSYIQYIYVLLLILIL